MAAKKAKVAYTPSAKELEAFAGAAEEAGLTLDEWIAFILRSASGYLGEAEEQADKARKAQSRKSLGDDGVRALRALAKRHQ